MLANSLRSSGGILPFLSHQAQHVLRSVTLGLNSSYWPATWEGQLRQPQGAGYGEGSRCGLVGRGVCNVFLHKKSLALNWKVWDTFVNDQRGLWLSYWPFTT